MGGGMLYSSTSPLPTTDSNMTLDCLLTWLRWQQRCRWNHQHERWNTFYFDFDGRLIRSLHYIRSSYSIVTICITKISWYFHFTNMKTFEYKTYVEVGSVNWWVPSAKPLNCVWATSQALIQGNVRHAWLWDKSSEKNYERVRHFAARCG